MTSLVMTDVGMAVSTEGFWQAFTAAPEVFGPPFVDRFPARIADDCFLSLPLRTLPDAPDRAIASLIANQASFLVADRLAEEMARRCGAARPEVVVGVPTLGLALAPLVARRLGFPNYVPLGYTRKFWYDDRLSTSVRSITSSGPDKRLYLDPNMIPRLDGRRTVVVDDVVSGGTSITAAYRLLDLVCADIVCTVVAMAQTNRWRENVGGREIHAVFDTPLFERRNGGWWPLAD
jgi:adenine/guanine phosphoribosyltransferase-like PRPP-binding protein